VYLTVTPNSALDRIFFIDRFVPGTHMRPHKMIESVGGKGFDASVVLRALGQETVGAGFVAGETGNQLVRLLEKYGIQHDLIWVSGETRISYVIAESEPSRHSHLTTESYRVSPEAYREFLDRYRERLPRAHWVIGGGSLPDGLPLDFYGTITTIAQACSVPVLIDCCGESARRALPTSPTILKINESEFMETFGVDSDSIGQLKENAVHVRESWGMQALVITCGERGIVGVTPDGAFLAIGPKQVEVNAAGAGDAISASLPWRLSLGDRWPEALRWTAAVGAAAVLTEGTADCNYADVERIYPEITVRDI
jgi:1-phosphofructokinase family hexose kinase